MPTPLSELLAADIARRGPLPFCEFMARALYDPAHGYYAAGRGGPGRAGDFFTSVSVGPLFARLLARQFAEMWERLGRPGEWAIVEQGADRGQFAADTLAALAELSPECAEAVRYTIVEPLAALRAEQGARLGGRAGWCESLDALAPFEGVHFSNELPDAFPVHLCVRAEDGWREKHVAHENGGFVFADGPLSDPRLAAELAPYDDLPPGFTVEISLAALDWIDSLAAKLTRGYVFAIDYGHTLAERRERSAGTLRAYAEHRAAPDPLATPGALDLTAHVDFSRLAARAVERGLAMCGFTDQHHLMVELGRQHFRDGVVPPAAEMRAFKTLMHPQFMGLAFRAICFARDLPAGPSLAGFASGALTT